MTSIPSRILGFLWATLFLPLACHAMSVLPPTFNELIDESTRIVRGTVVSVTPFDTTLANGASVVKTRVVWKLESTLKGSAETELTLDFLGGRTTTQSVEVPGMPAFAVGDTDYLFIGKNERALCPIIAGNQGRYHVEVEESTGIERVRPGPRPANRLASPATRAALNDADAAPEKVRDFEDAIRNRLAPSRQP